MEQYDVVIIGKGPAGISAALYTGRANLRTAVIGTDVSSLKKATMIENYYGFEQPVSGQALLDAGIKQASRLGVTIIEDEVTALQALDGFTVKTVKSEYAAKAVLIATGQSSQKVKISGLEQFEGRGVSYCTTCDGFFYKNKCVGILGSGNYAIQEAAELEAFTKDITIFTNGAELTVSDENAKKALKYNINKKPITKLQGEGILNEIIFNDGSQKISGLFIAVGTASSVDFAAKLGITVNNNAIAVDEKQQTNFKGIFAAGDCTGGFKQVSTAVGQGATAGKNIIEFIRKK